MASTRGGSVKSHTATVHVQGPWSLATSRRFWEEFAPSALAGQDDDGVLSATFRVERDWSRAEVEVSQKRATATIVVRGDGDLDSAAAQMASMLAIDVDGRGWPDVGKRDPVIADAQQQLPGLRPCGFYSPYEAAAWSVLSQRVRIVQAASLRDRLVREHGDDGAFPAPERLRSLDLDLPGRKAEYLQAVAGAALDGALDGPTLRALDPAEAVAQLQQIKGIGPFAAELIVLRGANVPDAIPQHERRLEAEIAEKYGSDVALDEVSEKWRPFRTWAAVHLRALRETRTHEISG